MNRTQRTVIGKKKKLMKEPSRLSRYYDQLLAGRKSRERAIDQMETERVN